MGSFYDQYLENISLGVEPLRSKFFVKIPFDPDLVSRLDQFVKEEGKRAFW
jgi:hypothetical protein